MRRCFACGRKVGVGAAKADTREDQWVYIGSECLKRLHDAGEAGWQPPRGGPRLYVMTDERWQYFVASGMDRA